MKSKKALSIKITIVASWFRNIVNCHCIETDLGSKNFKIGIRNKNKYFELDNRVIVNN